MQCAPRGAAIEAEWQGLVALCFHACRAATEGERLASFHDDPNWYGPPIVAFATEQGNAWLLELEARLALCLVWRREPYSLKILHGSQAIEVDWDGSFELRDAFEMDRIRTLCAGVSEI